MKTPIGGFFELEVAGGRGPYHTNAVPLCSGRACLRSILELMRPSRVWVPFYVCDAVFQAFTAAGVATELYSIDEAFDPVLPAGSPAGGEGLVYVNYFGLKTSTAASLVAAYPGQVIVDDTQSFFTKGYEDHEVLFIIRSFFVIFVVSSCLRDKPFYANVKRSRMLTPRNCWRRFPDPRRQ